MELIAIITLIVTAIGVIVPVWLSRSKKEQEKTESDKYPSSQYSNSTDQKNIQTEDENPYTYFFPYSVDRRRQIQHMSSFFPNNDTDLLWVFHGAYNQCLDEFMDCIKLFHWQKIFVTESWPEVIPFNWPHLKNTYHAERQLLKNIWNRVNNSKSIPLDTNGNIDSNLVFKELDIKYECPVLLSTKIEMEDWDQSLLVKLTQLSVHLKKNCKSAYPRILCILLEYNSHIPFYKKIFNQKRKVMNELNQNFKKNQIIPELIDIKKIHLVKWFQEHYGRPERDTVDEIFSKQLTIPMQVIAKKIKSRLVMSELARKYKNKGEYNS